MAKRLSTDNFSGISPQPPTSKSRRVGVKKSYKDNSDDENDDILTPRSPFGELGNITKTSLCSDFSGHVSHKCTLFLWKWIYDDIFLNDFRKKSFESCLINHSRYQFRIIRRVLMEDLWA